MDRPTRWPAFGLAGLLLAYAAGKAVFAAQGRLGFPGGPAISPAEHERYARAVMDVATAQWLAAATGVLGALLVIAAVSQIGRDVPRPAVLALLGALLVGVGAGAATMVVDGFGGPGPGWSPYYGAVGLVVLALLMTTIGVYVRGLRPAARQPHRFGSPLCGWSGAWLPGTGLLAVAWSAGYGLLGAFWWSGGGGFPYGAANDPAARLSLLGGVTQPAAAPAIAVLGIVGSGTAAAMARGWGRGWLRFTLTGIGIGIAFVLALLIPDYRVFVFVAYTPIVLLGIPFGLDPEVLSVVLTPPMINQIACIGGGVAWAAASVGYWQRTGTASHTARWRSVADAATWGRWATWVAAAVPLVYALTRYAWALDMPVGVDEDLFRRGQESGLWLIGAALGSLAVIGAVLTLGLVQRWGEVFPRWIPKVGGRQVPPALVIVPATAVALLVTNAGLMFWRMTLSGGFLLGDIRLTLEDDWAALTPELLWPVWGVALGGATFAYYLRRRSPGGATQEQASVEIARATDNRRAGIESVPARVKYEIDEEHGAPRPARRCPWCRPR